MTWHRAFAALLVALVTAPLAGIAAPANPAAGRPALVVETLNGATFDLAAERGKWVIVNFWATWCAPCIEEMPAISRFVAAHPNVSAIGMAWEDTPRDKLLAFVRKHPVGYPLAQVDLQHPPADFAAPLGLPTTFLIAPDGRIAQHFIGPVDGAMLAKAIATHKQTPSPAKSPEP